MWWALGVVERIGTWCIWITGKSWGKLNFNIDSKVGGDRRKTGLNVTDVAWKSYFERMWWALGVVERVGTWCIWITVKIWVKLNFNIDSKVGGDVLCVTFYVDEVLFFMSHVAMVYKWSSKWCCHVLVWEHDFFNVSLRSVLKFWGRSNNFEVGSVSWHKLQFDLQSSKLESLVSRNRPDFKIVRPTPKF